MYISRNDKGMDRRKGLRMEKKLTMLITDDVELNRVSLREIFREEYEILMAKNGEIALDIMRNQKVDLLVLDLFMPVKDGFAVIREMKQDKKLSEIPIIVKTAIDENTELKVLDLGADEFIFSPFDPEVMKVRVRNIAEKYVLEKEKIKEQLEQVIREFKGPIGDILGVTQLSEEKESMSPEVVDTLEKVKSEAECLLSMVNDAMEHTYVPEKKKKSFLGDKDKYNRHKNATQNGAVPSKFDAIHALVIDRDEITRNYQTSILTRLGILYDTAGNEEEALAIMERAHLDGNDFNICFINWQSSQEEVGDLISHIRGKYNQDAQIIAVASPKSADTKIGEMKTAGVDYVLAKPVLQSKMYNIITDICNTSRQKEDVEAKEKNVCRNVIWSQ